MDAYDIFKKLTKGLTFKKRVLGVKTNEQQTTSKPLPIKKEENLTIAKDDPLDNEDNLSIKSEPESDAETVKSGSESEGSDDDLKFVEGIKLGEKKPKKKKKEKTEDLKKKLELEEQNRFRNEHGIKAVGRHIPAALQNFSDLMQRYGVSQEMVDTIIQCGYTEPTPVQRQAIPCMLEDRQILACAPTGSGKTAAFLVPLLQALGGAGAAGGAGPRAVVLAPTRELAQQTHRELLRLSAPTTLRCSVLKDLKENRIRERESTFRKSDIIITTPNRLCYLLNHENVNVSLEQVRWLVLDEADKLFEGSTEQAADFRQQLQRVLGACGARRRVAMLSATHTPALAKWSRRHLRGLVNITVGQRNAATNLVEQELLYCGNENGKLIAFRQLVQKGLKPPVLVFVQSKDRAKQLFKELIYDGINVDVIHADRTQLQRDNVVRSFRVGRIWVLICTELLARGVDFRGVNLVVNYDFPPSAIAYIHRIGRAGRAGQRGRAVTFFTQDDVVNLRSIASVMKQSGCEVPQYMLQLKQDANKRKRLLVKAPRRDHISTVLGKRPDKRKLEDGKEPEKSDTASAVTEKVVNAKNKKHRRKHPAKENPFSAKKDTGKVVKRKKKNKLGKKKIKPSKA